MLQINFLEPQVVAATICDRSAKGHQFLVQCGAQERNQGWAEDGHHGCGCNDEASIVSRVAEFPLQHVVTDHFKWEDHTPNCGNT